MSSFVTAMKEISTVMTSPLSLDQTHTTTFHHSFLLLIKIFLSLMILEANLMLWKCAFLFAISQQMGYKPCWGTSFPDHWLEFSDIDQQRFQLILLLRHLSLILKQGENLVKSSQDISCVICLKGTIVQEPSLSHHQGSDVTRYCKHPIFIPAQNWCSQLGWIKCLLYLVLCSHWCFIGPFKHVKSQDTMPCSGWNLHLY